MITDDKNVRIISSEPSAHAFPRLLSANMSHALREELALTVSSVQLYLPASYANVAVLTVLVYDYGKGKTCLALLDADPRQVISLETEVCQ